MAAGRQMMYTLRGSTSTPHGFEMKVHRCGVLLCYVISLCMFIDVFYFACGHWQQQKNMLNVQKEHDLRECFFEATLETT